MHSQSNSINVWKGSFRKVNLDYSPEPPLSQSELSKLSENYTTASANFHIYLDGNDATKGLPPTYLLLLLDNLLAQFGNLLEGKKIIAQWFSDPWRLELTGKPSQNKVLINLRVPNRWVVMEGVSVPLDLFAKELINLARDWGKYLEQIYYDEINDPDWGEHYRRYKGYLENVQSLLNEYETG